MSLRNLLVKIPISHLTTTMQFTKKKKKKSYQSAYSNLTFILVRSYSAGKLRPGFVLPVAAATSNL